MKRKRVWCAWLLTAALVLGSAVSCFGETAESETAATVQTMQEEVTEEEQTSLMPQSTEDETADVYYTEGSLEAEETVEDTCGSAVEESFEGEETKEESTEEKNSGEADAEGESSEGEDIEEEGIREESTEEESTEEESTEEESTEEEISEDDIEWILSRPMQLNLGDVTQIVAITACRIEGDIVILDAVMNEYFTTWNHTLYLFESQMYEKDISGEPIASVEMDEDTMTYRFCVPLNSDSSDFRLYSKFFVGVKFRNGEYHALSDGKFITNPEVMASNQSAYPAARSKKGIFAEMFWGTDLDELGVSYTNVNIVINELFDGDGISYTYKGKSYSYCASYVESLDRTLQMMQKNHIIVTAILLARPGCGTFGYPGIDQSVGSYHGWNVVTQEGVECVSAVLHFLGERYGRSDCAYGHISNWIVGNEVNADTSWNYTGHQSVYDYALIYANMLRITYQAVKSSCAHARVYMPLDMFWNNSESSARYDGKDMIDLVNTYIKAEGDIAWGVAFHPYGNPLTEPEWWNDNAEQSENAGFISMQNLSVLTNYLQKSELRDPDGSVKKVILSEEGYTSWSSNQGDVAWKQAAAYAYAYYVAEANPYIQAFTVMRQKDAELEAKDGLHQGMWYDDSTKDFCTFGKKPVWTVWKYIDTDKGFEYTDPLASIVGLSSFSETYAGVMASKCRSVVSGESGYASEFQGTAALEGGWQAEYMLSSLEVNGGTIKGYANSNSPFTYSGICWNGTADFSGLPYFGFDFIGTAGADQNLRVRMRFTSGQNVYETETAVKKDTVRKIYADLSGWSGKSAVNKIQIWVQQDGTSEWENGSFTISGICMASGIRKEAAPSIEITNAAAASTGSTGFDVSCTISGSGIPDRVEFTAWNVQAGTGSAVTVESTASEDAAWVHFNISSFGNRTGVYSIRIVAYDREGFASKETIVTVTVKGAPEALVISNGYISDITYTSFKITVEAKSEYGLSSASQVAVWSTKANSSGNAQDDLVWYPLNFVNGKATVTVLTSNHKEDGGEYMCHAYVKDGAGTMKIFPMTATVPSKQPEITSVNVDHVTAYGYTVTCTFNCYYGVREVKMPTWSDENGQDDIVWYQASVAGNKAALNVYTKNHNNAGGLYKTHIYVYDNLSGFTVRTIEIKLPEWSEPKAGPTVKKIETTEVTGGGYRVICLLDAPNGISEVYMPSWTDNSGQDDIIWYKASVTGNTATVYIPAADHGNESGQYTTHVYVTDKAGKQTVGGTAVTLPKSGSPDGNFWCVMQNGTIDWSYTGLAKHGETWYYAKNGMADWNYSGLAEYQGTYYCVRNGILDWNYTGLVTYNGGCWYVQKGVLHWGMNGLIRSDGCWYYVKDSQVDWSYNSLVYYEGTWYCVRNGVLDWSYTGLVTYRGKSYYVQGGVLYWGVNGLFYCGEKWYYIVNSTADWSYSGLAYRQGTWYYVKNGVLDWEYTGLADYNGKSYFVQNGVLYWGLYGLVTDGDSWYNVANSVLFSSYTGLVSHQKNWYYVKAGILDWNYTGMTVYNGNTYYVENGYLSWKQQGLTYVNGTWYDLVNSTVRKSYTGLVFYKNDWYYVKKGVLDWNYTGVTEYNGNQYYVCRGKLNWGIDGIVECSGTFYYLTNSMVDRSFSGSVIYEGNTYTVKNGIAVLDKS